MSTCKIQVYQIDDTFPQVSDHFLTGHGHILMDPPALTRAGFGERVSMNAISPKLAEAISDATRGKGPCIVVVDDALLANFWGCWCDYAETVRIFNASQAHEELLLEAEPTAKRIVFYNKQGNYLQSLIEENPGAEFNPYVTLRRGWGGTGRRFDNAMQYFHAPFVVKPEKTRYGSKSGSNWNLGVVLNKDNEITIGHQKKKHFHAMLNNYILDRRNGTAWPLEDIMAFNGLISYYKMVEKPTIEGIIGHYNQKYGVNTMAMIKADIAA
ncbi:MAG: hypothetical protein FWC27_12435 [Firmicutes bacterium]|nr:hypothetical protein [Bacillota bacterium]